MSFATFDVRTLFRPDVKLPIVFSLTIGYNSSRRLFTPFLPNMA